MSLSSLSHSGDPRNASDSLPQPSATEARSSKKSPSHSNPTPATKQDRQRTEQKKVPRRSSKPIINWFQRKLAGTVRAKRVENLPLAISDYGRGGRNSHSRAIGRVTSGPPSQTFGTWHPGKLDPSTSNARRKTISLSGEDEIREFGQAGQAFSEDDISVDRSSFARSTWSPASALEADDDASVRPIPPSAPPSPSPSRSSSSYLSDPRTFKSMAASTKPTTLLSIDMNGNGMAHIAQAPNTPTSQFHRFAPHMRQSSSLSSPGLIGSAASITFSALPHSSSRPSSLNRGSFISSSPTQSTAPNNGQVSPIQAPLHTTHHPRNNPRPSSPPLDNASVLTLASSAFATPLRANVAGLGTGDSVSHFGGSTFADAESTSQFVLGDDERLDERDADASVRALRPRSSRRGSWESEVSRWSARVQQGPGTPSLVRERSLWTSNSVRTGGFSLENGDNAEDSRTEENDMATGEVSPSLASIADTPYLNDKDTLNYTLPDTTSSGEGPEDVTPEDSSIPRLSSTETIAQQATIMDPVDVSKQANDIVSRTAAVKLTDIEPRRMNEV